MGKKSELSAEQRVQLVLRLLSKEEPAVQIARRAGISEQTLYRWRDESSAAASRRSTVAGRTSKRRRSRGSRGSWPSAIR